MKRIWREFETIDEGTCGVCDDDATIAIYAGGEQATWPAHEIDFLIDALTEIKAERDARPADRSLGFPYTPFLEGAA